MPKRGGLGQRGLDILISASAPSAAQDNDDPVQEEDGKEKNTSGKASGKKTAAKSTGKSASSKTAGKSASSKTAGKSASSKSAGKSTTSKTAGKGTSAKTSAKSGAGKGAAAKNAQTKKATAKNADANIYHAGAHTEEAAVTGASDISKTVKRTAQASGSTAQAADANAQALRDPVELPIEQIEPNRAQPRKNFDEDALQELADSIRQFGVIQPLIVTKKDDYYEIIAGERRWRASRMAGLKKIPVIVKDYTDREVMEISLIENIQREDLNPIEEAMAYKNLMEEYDLRQDEVAQRVSRSRASIANSVRLLNLDERVQQMVISDMLSTGHARALLAVSDPELQYTMAQRVFDEKMSVRDVERMVRRQQKGPAAEKRPAVSDTLLAVYASMEETMKSALGTKVSIAPKNAQKGKIEIEYYSSDDLDRLCELLRSPLTEGRE